MTEIPDNPDRPCNSCGNRDWTKYEERKPSEYPESSDVIKHFYICSNCSRDGFIYEENGSLQYTGGLR